MTSQFKKGHCYRMKALELGTFIGVYIGRERGFSCCVCGKGDNAHCFNVYDGDNENPTAKEVQDYISNVGYETFPFGTEHLPEILEEIQ